MLKKRYIMSIKRDIFVLISIPVFLFQFLFCYILERKDKKWFERDIIVLISFLILFVSISFLANIGKEMSLPGFCTLNLIVRAVDWPAHAKRENKDQLRRCSFALNN